MIRSIQISKSLLGENPAGLQLNSSPDHRPLHYGFMIATFLVVQNLR